MSRGRLGRAEVGRSASRLRGRGGEGQRCCARLLQQPPLCLQLLFAVVRLLPLQRVGSEHGLTRSTGKGKSVAHSAQLSGAAATRDLPGPALTCSWRSRSKTGNSPWLLTRNTTSADCITRRASHQLHESGHEDAGAGVVQRLRPRRRRMRGHCSPGSPPGTPATTKDAVTQAGRSARSATLR